MLRKWVLAALCGVLLTGTTAALAAAPTGDEFAKAKLDARHSGGGSGGGTGDVPRTKNFRVLGHQRPGTERVERRRLRARELRLRRAPGATRATGAASRSLTSATSPTRS